MFYFLSKILWDIVAPNQLIALLVVVSAILLLTRWRRAGVALSIVAALLVVVAGLSPLGKFLLQRLEYRIAPAQLPAHVDGILTLGGGNAKDHMRLSSVFILSRRYPGARIIYSGGSGDLLDEDPKDGSNRAQAVLLDWGLDPARLTLENRSRNTWENIGFSRRIARPRPGDVWILATSASQMLRAMEVANQLGWRLLPWPTDYVMPAGSLRLSIDVSDNMGDLNVGLRQWIGLYAYRWTHKAKPL